MNPLSQAIRARFTAMLGRHLPGRTKRLIFLASFTARLKDSTDLTGETLSRLNQLMVLANTESAIKLPVQLSRAIWHGKTHTEICEHDICRTPLSQESIVTIARRVSRTMPAWLRYGDDSAIQQDVARLLDHRSLVLGT